MKKAVVCIICLLIAIALPFAIFAEETSGTDVDEDLPAIVETTAVFETAAVPDTQEPSTEEVVGIVKTTSDKLVSWAKKNYEEISVVISLFLMARYEARKHKMLNRSIGVLNNNAITISEKSEKAIKEIHEEMMKLAADKKILEKKLFEAIKFINTAKLANLELANEVAELLVLANIPNSKKDELYKRHLKAVDAIASADFTEVKADDGKKA